MLTLSFHQSGQSFFPRTGHSNDSGGKRGAGYSLNFPLNAGMDDESYASCFQPVIQKVMEVYAPSVVVMCCGADSLSGDRVGLWNLSIKGHAAVIECNVSAPARARARTVQHAHCVSTRTALARARGNNH